MGLKEIFLYKFYGTNLNSRSLLIAILVYPEISFACLDLCDQFHSNKTEI